jgi:hypothetical protein
MNECYKMYESESGTQVEVVQLYYVVQDYDYDYDSVLQVQDTGEHVKCRSVL